jgi:periplasmic protein CpxP/Spy
MKLFKSIAVAALLLVGTAAMAQGPQGGQGGRQRMSATELAKSTTDRLTESLGLSADQKTKVLEVSLKYAAKDSIRRASFSANQGQNVDREAMMQEMQKQREAQTTEIKALLTDAQKTKYDAFLEESRNRGFGGGGGQR